MGPSPIEAATEAIRRYRQELQFGKTDAAAQAIALQAIREAVAENREPAKGYPKLADDPGLPPGWAPDPHE